VKYFRGGEGLEYLEKEDDHKNPARGYIDKGIFAMQSRKRWMWWGKLVVAPTPFTI
jgi:hypothetical protein